ncbi:prephenate dehydratase [Kovacikia minuta CCNUW1]|nr:prephenate dehydratase [Kovacikia minuta]UBF29736.1 prephenate dehydratase [Kovacikia minuta CCNUW1]
MTLSIAHLGPSGTNAETATLQYATWLKQKTGQSPLLCPYPSIARTLQAVAQGKADLAVVPVENSIEGSVTVTLDTLWQLDSLKIQQELVLPIEHALLSQATALDTIHTVYSHPQALAQCQRWLEEFLPQCELIPTNSTTDALPYLQADPAVGAISSPRAAQLYNLPILACPINDYPDNCTRFWALSLHPSPGGNHTSLAFIVHDAPGALVKSLQLFASQNINLSRIESRPTKRSLGDYLFFVDLEGNAGDPSVQAVLETLTNETAILKVFGSYNILPIEGSDRVELG